MKLIGNSVSVPVIDKLCNAIIQTGVFQRKQPHNKIMHMDRKSLAEKDEPSFFCQ